MDADETLDEPNIVWDVRKGMSELVDGDAHELIVYIDALRSALSSARADALEEAAKVCDPEPAIPPDGSTSYVLLTTLAKRIRSLKDAK